MTYLDKHHKVIGLQIIQDRELHIQMFQHHNNFHQKDGRVQTLVTHNKCYINNMLINLYSHLQLINRWWVRIRQDCHKIWNGCPKITIRQLQYILNNTKKDLHLSNKSWINNKFKTRAIKNFIKYIWIICLMMIRRLILTREFQVVITIPVVKVIRLWKIDSLEIYSINRIHHSTITMVSIWIQMGKWTILSKKIQGSCHFYQVNHHRVKLQSSKPMHRKF